MPENSRHRRGRWPDAITLDPADAALLEQVASSQFWPWYQVRKAKAVLAIANGGRVCEVSEQLNYSPASIWRCRQRFASGGVAELLMEKHRTGRPRKSVPEDRRELAGITTHEAPVAVVH